MEFPRLIVSVWGLPKTGKTHLALTFPAPIAAIEVGETGIEDLLPTFKDKRIDHYPLIISSLSPVLEDHQALLKTFESILFDRVLATAAYNTLVIDSASRLWRSIRVVKTQEAREEANRQRRSQADFELANDYFEQIIQVARKLTNLNIVLVHRHREKFAVVSNEYGGQSLQATGEVESRDYKGIENLVQVMVRTGTGTRFNPRTREDDQVFLHTIELCRFNKGLEGASIPNLTYDVLVERIFRGHPAA